MKLGCNTSISRHVWTVKMGMHRFRYSFCSANLKCFFAYIGTEEYYISEFENKSVLILTPNSLEIGRHILRVYVREISTTGEAPITVYKQVAKLYCFKNQ